MKRVIQVISIGLAAYQLYVLVNDFLETDTGKQVKDKVEPYIKDAVEADKGYAEKVMDKVEEQVPVVAETIEEKI